MIDSIRERLGPDASRYLDHVCKTVPKSRLHLPGPDFVDRVFLATDRPRAETIAAAIEQHRLQLAAAGLTMDSPILRLGVARLTLRLLKETLWLLLGLIPALAGTLHHLAPFAVTRFIVRFIKHPGRVTVAQNRLMIGIPIYAIWYATVWLFIEHHHGAGFAWLWTALMPFCGVAALHYAWRTRVVGRAWAEG